MKKIRTLLLLLCSFASVWVSAQGVQTFTLIPETGYTGTPYQVKYVRNVSTYPLTDDGLTLAKRDLVSGTFSLSVVSSGTYSGNTYTPTKYYASGCVIPAGTKPGVSPPGCASISSGGLPILATNTGLTSRYTYSAANGGTIQIRAMGSSSATLKIETVSGQPLTLSNSQNSTIPYNTYVGYGPSGDSSYPMDWTLWGVSQVPVKISFKTGGNADVATFTPTIGSNISLTGPTGTTTVTPPTQTTTTTPPTQSGNGTFYAGYGEGTLSELMAFAPFVPSNDQNASWQVGNTTQYVTIGTGLKFGINNSIGGSITHLSLNGGENQINTTTQKTSMYKGVLSPDDGRSLSISTYANPDGFRGGPGSQNGRFVDTGEDGQTHVSSQIGWNAVPGGEDGNANRGKILFYERRTVAGYGEVLYTKNQTYQWGMSNTLAKQYLHHWTWAEGQAIRWFAVLENFRNDGQGTYQAREQEKPFMFLVASRYRKVSYTGTSPGTSGGLSEFTSTEPCEGVGSPGCPNANDTGTWLASEYWAGGMTGDGSKIVANVTPYNTRYRGKQEQSFSGNEFSNATSYINSAAMENYDEPSTRAFSGYIYTGNTSDFRNWYNGLNLVTTPFSWNFTNGHTCAWWSENGPARQINGQYQFNIGFGRPGDNGTSDEGKTVHFATFASPFGAWKASEIPVIYVKGRFTGTGTIQNLKLTFRKPGPEHDAPEYEKTFTVQATNAEQTIPISMVGVDNWNGIISNIRIKLANTQQATNGDEMFIPTYIGKNNPN